MGRLLLKNKVQKHLVNTSFFKKKRKPPFNLLFFADNATTAAGCPFTGKAALNCLRSASLGMSQSNRWQCGFKADRFGNTGALVSAVNHVQSGKFAPIISGPGTILPDFPAELIRTGQFTCIDYIGGHCSNDGRTFTSGSPTTLLTEDQLIAAVLKRWPSLVRLLFDHFCFVKHYYAIVELYPVENAESLLGSKYSRESF